MQDFDYQAAIERLPDFPPVAPLWPIGARLLVWLALEAALVIAAALLLGPAPLIAFGHSYAWSIPAFFLVGGCAAWLALRSAIPGRTVSARHAGLLAILLFATLLIAVYRSPLGVGAAVTLAAYGSSSILRVIMLSAIPWLALYWAARRAAPLWPARTGALIGMAAGCSGVALVRLDALSSSAPTALHAQVIALLIIVAGSAALGARFLAPERLRRDRAFSPRDSVARLRLADGWLMPAAMTAAALLLGFSLHADRVAGAVPDFDLTIAQYQDAMRGFEANVPSQSIDTVLAAYIEHGMPSYMWDFGPQGFKLVGGRIDHLKDGAPVTFTWFRGASGGMMCLFRKTSAFMPPALPHVEHRGLIFYRYRGFSICLINVGNYGNFVSVIASPMPLARFERLVSQSAG